MLVVISLLTGAALGTRFKVLALFPVIGVALGVTVVGGVARDETVSGIVLSSFAVLAGLQFGYLAGLLLRHAWTAERATFVAAGSLPSPAQTRDPIA
jgi:hypothetical protein